MMGKLVPFSMSLQMRRSLTTIEIILCLCEDRGTLKLDINPVI